MSASPSQFPTAQGALVPLDPSSNAQTQLEQERREEVMNAPRLLKYLNKTLDAISQLDQNENLKIHNEMVRCVAYYDGRQDGQCKNGEWVDNPTIDGEITPKDNEYKKQIDKLLMEMSRSKIDYEVEAVNKFSAEMREAAQFAQRRLEVNQDRIETEPFVQAENMSLLLKFNVYRYTFFDRNAESPEKSVELNVLKHLTEGSQATVCRTCGRAKADASLGATGIEAMKMAPCPYCGDTESKPVSAPAGEGMKIESNQKSAGRVVTVRPDATMVQLDLNARDIQSSSFIRWRLVLRRCDWEAMYPNQRIPSNVQSAEGRHRSQSQNQSSNSEWGVSSDDAGGGQFEKIEGELVWLEPKVYQRYVNKETETLRNGTVLEAGAMFVDAYRDGACVVRIDQTILDIYPSNKNKCWTMCVYGLREHALHGSGTTALLGPQDTINDENAFIVAHHYYMAAGREFVRSGALEGGQLPPYNKVGIIEAPTDVANITEWAYGRSQPESLAADVYGFRDAMRGSLQDAAGTSSLSMQGAADMKQLGTATGVEASRDQAVGRMIPNRKLQAHAGAEWAKQVLELERDNYSPETFLEMAGKANEKGEIDYTERGVETFFNLDVCNGLIVKPSEGSWVPETTAQKAAKAATFAQMAGQVKGDPQMMSLLAPNLNIDYSIDEWGAAQRNASMRLQEYARVSQIVSEGGYPASPEMVQVVLSNIAEWARVNPQMDKHEAFRNFYEDWWISDEGRNADSLLRLVVETVHDLHLNKGLVAQAQSQGAAQIAAQAPQQAIQEQMMRQQQAQQQQEMAAADEQGKAEMVQQALGEQALKERDREHEMQTQMAVQDHQTQNEIAKKAFEVAVTPEPKPTTEK